MDKQIKAFEVGPNPYTWFTMETLEETWRNLQKIIKVSSKHRRVNNSGGDGEIIELKI